MTCANNASYMVKGIGQVAITSVTCSVITLENVLYVLGIRKNLISISAIATCGFRIVFDGHTCAIYDLSHADAIVLIGTLQGGFYSLDVSNAYFWDTVQRAEVIDFMSPHHVGWLSVEMLSLMRHPLCLCGIAKCSPHLLSLTYLTTLFHCLAMMPPMMHHMALLPRLLLIYSPIHSPDIGYMY